MNFYKRLRQIIIADPFFIEQIGADVIAQRVYTTHLKNIRNPQYPCMSFHHQKEDTDPIDKTLRNVFFQLDLWSESSFEEVERLYEDDQAATITEYGAIQGLFALLHGKSFGSTNIAIQKILLQKGGKGPWMIEAASGKYHMPTKWWAQYATQAPFA